MKFYQQDDFFLILTQNFLHRPDIPQLVNILIDFLLVKDSAQSKVEEEQLVVPAETSYPFLIHSVTHLDQSPHHMRLTFVRNELKRYVSAVQGHLRPFQDTPLRTELDQTIVKLT